MLRHSLKRLQFSTCNRCGHGRVDVSGSAQDIILRDQGVGRRMLSLAVYPENGVEDLHRGVSIRGGADPVDAIHL